MLFTCVVMVEQQKEKDVAAARIRKEQLEQAAKDREHDLATKMAEDKELAAKKVAKKIVTSQGHSVVRPNPARGTHGGTVRPFIPPGKIAQAAVLGVEIMKHGTNKQFASTTKLQAAKMKRQKAIGKQPK